MSSYIALSYTQIERVQGFENWSKANHPSEEPLTPSPSPLSSPFFLPSTPALLPSSFSFNRLYLWLAHVLSTHQVLDTTSLEILGGYSPYGSTHGPYCPDQQKETPFAFYLLRSFCLNRVLKYKSEKSKYLGYVRKIPRTYDLWPVISLSPWPSLTQVPTWLQKLASSSSMLLILWFPAEDSPINSWAPSLIYISVSS